MATRVTSLPRPLLVLGLALAVLLVPFVAPIGIARACGCGAYSPTDGGTASVPQEVALVRTAGDGVQDIYLSLRLDSNVRSGALLFPVPDPKAVVSAGPRDLFDDLYAITAPRPATTSTGSGVAGAPRGGVTVQNRQAIGPLDVVTLTSSDPASLTQWLQRNGFAAKPALAAAAAPYVSKGWAFVAVRLNPAAGSTAPLDGQLDPLHIRFRSDEIVYPMRLSAMASAPEQVIVFTLSRQPLALETGTYGMSRVYSARLDAGAHPRLASVTASGTTWLGRWNGTLSPSDIVDDFHFVPGPAQLATSGDVISPTASASYRPTGDVALPADGGADGDGLAIGVTIGVVVLAAAGFVVVARRRGTRSW